MSGDSSLGIGIGLALKSYGRAFTYVKTDRALDLGNLAPFTIPDLSGNANTATLYSGIYVTTNGTTDKAIGANATALGSGNYYLSGKIKPAGTTAKTTMDGSTASNLTGLTASVWQDFQTATASAITPSSINLGWDGTAFNATVDNWSDVKLHDASDDSVVAHWKLYDSADASLDGYPALDCVGGFYGAHVGCAGGASEASILQTAGEDFNKRALFGVSGRVAIPTASTRPFQGGLTMSARVVRFASGGARVWEQGAVGSGQLHRLLVSAPNPATNKSTVIFRYRWGTSGDAIWETDDEVITVGVAADISVTYDSDDVANDPTIRVNGNVVSITETVTPSGASLVADTDLIIGNSESFDAGFLGLISDVVIGTSTYSGKNASASEWVDPVNGRDGVVAGDVSNYFIPESETTAGQDALGNAIENPRPNDRVANLGATDAQVTITDDASLDSLNVWAQWFYYDGNDGDIIDMSNGAGTTTIEVTTSALASTGLTTPVYYVGNKTTAVANTTTLTAGWNYIAVTFVDFTPTADLLALRTGGHFIAYDETKVLADLEKNRAATKGIY